MIRNMPSLREILRSGLPAGPPRKRPYDLAFAVDERPPMSALWVLGAQHAITVLASVVYVLAAARMAGLDAGGAHALVAVSLIGMALCTAFQAWGGRLGSASLMVHQPDAFAITIAASVIALQGPGAMAGLTVISAVVALVIAPLMPRLRAVFPPAVAGTVILMGGLTLIEPTLRQAFGIDDTHRFDPVSALIACSALVCMVALPVWAKGRLRLIGLLTGIVIGVLVAAAAGQLSGLGPVLEAPWVALPAMHAPVLGLDSSLILIVVLIAVVKQLDNVGCVITVDKMNNADWRRPDMKSLSGGIKANGLGDLIAGFAGAFPTGISSSCIALAHATRSTSRHIGLAVAAILLALVFLPKATILLTLVPVPVLGAVGIYASAFLILSGVELIASRALDSRTIFAVGFATLAGVGLLILPDTVEQIPEELRKLLGNPLIVSSIVVVALNLLFRIGIAQNARLELATDDPHPGRTITDFVERQGALWSVRRELVQRAASAALEAAESISAAGRGWPVAIQGRFDEFRLDIELVHAGAPLDLQGETSAVMNVEALMDADDIDTSALDAMMNRVSSVLILRLADRVSAAQTREGVATLRLHFDH
jgi:xanthine permease XanP